MRKQRIVNLKQAAERLGVSYSFASSLKKLANIQSRLFEFRRLQAYWRANPNVKSAEAWGKRRKVLHDSISTGG